MDRRHRYAALIALAVPLAAVVAAGQPATLSSLAAALALSVTGLVAATILAGQAAARSARSRLPVRVSTRAAYQVGRHEALPGDPDRPGRPGRPRPPGLSRHR